jgi:dipeptide/tripeptide permease
MFRGINEGDKNALLVGAVMIIIGIVLLGVTSSLVTANLSIRTV